MGKRICIDGIRWQMTNPYDIRAKEIGHLLDVTGHGHRIFWERGPCVQGLAIHLVREGGGHITQGPRNGVLWDEATHLHLQSGTEATAPGAVKTALPLIDPLNLFINDLCGWPIDPLQNLDGIRVKTFDIERASITRNDRHFSNLLSDGGRLLIY
jgi:hypothetical protein